MWTAGMARLPYKSSEAALDPDLITTCKFSLSHKVFGQRQGGSSGKFAARFCQKLGLKQSEVRCEKCLQQHLDINTVALELV